MTLHRTTLLLTGTILLAGVDSAFAQPANSIRLKTLVVQDTRLGLPAFRVLIPADWQGQGKVIWRAHAVLPTTSMMTAWNPKGSEAVRVYPNIPFVEGVREASANIAAIAGPHAMQFVNNSFPEGSHYLGNEVRRFVGGPKEYVTQILLPRMRPEIKGYRVTGMEEMPRWAQETVVQAGTAPGVTVHAQAARVRIEYQENGRAIHEDFFILLPRVSFQGMSYWGAESASSVRADAGKLDAANKIHNAMLVSLKIDLRWYSVERQISQLLIQDFYKHQANIMALSEHIARTQNEISNMISSSYWNRQKSLDRIHSNFSQYIRGVNTYVSPSSSYPVELPSGYNHAWVNGLGEYILSNDSFFNPNQTSSGKWTQMKKAQ